MKFTISKDVEVILNNEKYLLEKGDIIEIDQKYITETLKHGAPPSLIAHKKKMENIDKKIDKNIKTSTPQVTENRNVEVITMIINDLAQEMPIDKITTDDVVQEYNKRFDPINKEAGKLLPRDLIDKLIRVYIKRAYSMI